MKTLLIITCALFLWGCSPKNYAIGTAEKDFLKHNHAAILVQSSSNGNVYKKVDYGFGHPPSVRFYYFQSGLLVQVDEGVHR